MTGGAGDLWWLGNCSPWWYYRRPVSFLLALGRQGERSVRSHGRGEICMLTDDDSMAVPCQDSVLGSDEDIILAV